MMSLTSNGVSDSARLDEVVRLLGEIQAILRELPWRIASEIPAVPVQPPTYCVYPVRVDPNAPICVDQCKRTMNSADPPVRATSDAFCKAANTGTRNTAREAL